ncbi:MAG TPA: hypothetical protein DHD79_08580 [Firmicutes bacterium]|jgi:GNAT superfamily N-acetyltransferase|nr:hypothetical protein [Bacillota bacterium]HAW70214.1 hypothetical protein [Bacillota bacterium]HAZ22263.1 hypothetical protein [Bacillota bacterium]HBE07112.1 hypothetical protein [Bacillota bacterium]HBL50131.1 hypothetical protein [Bacillota bacterium]
MSVAVDHYRDSYLPGIVNIYNEMSTLLPYHWPVSIPDFVSAILVDGPLHDGLYQFDPQELIVALDSQKRVTGFLHYTEARGSGKGSIRVIFAAGNESESIADALLGEALSRLYQSGANRIVAWPIRNGYPFYGMTRGACWSGFRLDELLLAKGFRRYPAEIPETFYATALPKVRFIALPGSGIQFNTVASEEPIGLKAPLLTRRHTALLNGNIIGDACWFRLDELQGHPEARQIAYILRLGILQDFIKEGITRTLLLQAFQAMAGEGIRAVALTCGPEVAPDTIDLLKSLGFVPLGASFRYVKET